MSDKTVGQLCEEVKAAAPAWVPIGYGMVARYMGEANIADWLGPDWKDKL